MSILWTPAVEVESVNGTREISLYTRHLMNRNLFLTGEINADMANSFVAQLLYLEETPDEPVTLYIDSPGGEINARLMIYDAIQGSRLEINMICTGLAASMAAVLLAGGQHGSRYILRHSKVMIHEPLLANGVGGSATSIRKLSESIIETREMINEILAKHTGKTVEEINEATSFDNYMRAEEAIAFGLCDRITDSVKID